LFGVGTEAKSVGNSVDLDASVVRIILLSNGEIPAIARKRNAVNEIVADV
jgi:hypothetical protein